MATYDVTVHFHVEDRDNLPGLIVEDILYELSSCWHTLENLSIVITGDIVTEVAGPRFRRAWKWSYTLKNTGIWCRTEKADGTLWTAGAQ